MNTPINDKLNELKTRGKCPFHMPGHKRKTGESQERKLEAEPSHNGIYAINQICEIDITEISGYDNLHHPQGMIRESMDNLKKICHTKESWYLVNGSTAGILAAISAACRPGDKIVIARNCHKSVYNAVRLRRLIPVYLSPGYHEEYDIMLDIGPREQTRLAEILKEEEDVRAVVITSPTYEGVVSDIGAIRKVISEYDDTIPLIVDEAHGAHLHFLETFPESAVTCGGDIVVQSTHKTLPSLTQTGLLHLCSDKVPARDLSFWLSVYETSSPSYILMASAEYGVIFMHNSGKKRGKYVDNLENFRKNCGQLIQIHLLEAHELPVFAYDMGKLVFVVKKKKNGGLWLFERLRDEWNIELEMAGRTCALAMTSVMDEREDFQALFTALQSLDEELISHREPMPPVIHNEMNPVPEEGVNPTTKEGIPPLSEKGMIPIPEKVMESWECEGMDQELLPLSECTGHIAADYVMLYPPGIPLLVPGEKIIKEMVENLMFYLYNGYNVQGLHQDCIPVLLLSILETAGGTNERNIYCDGRSGRFRKIHTD